MRKNLKTLAPTLWFVIIAFIVSIFAVWGGAGRLGEARDSNTIVKVGGEKISADIYYRNLLRRLESLKEQFKGLNVNFIQQLNIPQQVLDQLIQQAILQQLAEKMKIHASDEELRQRIKDFPVFQKDGKFIGYSEYKKILDWNRISVSEFEKSLRKDIITQKAAQMLTTGIAVSQEEIWESYKNNNETAKLEYLVIEANKMTLKDKPTQEELQDFFTRNKDQYKMPEKREAIYVFFETDEQAKMVELSDSEIEKYYKQNSSRFQEPEQIRVSRIFFSLEGREKELVLSEAQNTLNQINQGEDFGVIAKEKSKDEKAQDNGDWGYFEWKRLSPQEQEEIRKLSQGETSDPVEISDGYSLLKVTEKTAPTQKPLDQVRGEITTLLKDQKARDAIDKKITQLEKKAKKRKSLETAAQELGYPTKRTGLLEDETPIENIDSSGAISRALFNLEENEISSPIFTYKGVALVQLLNSEKERPATFDEVTTEVKEESEKEKRKEMAHEQAKAIKNELNKSNIEKIAEKYSLEVKAAEEHKRGQYLGGIAENPEIDELAFSLSLNEVSSPIEFDKGYILLQVLDRKEVSRDDFEENKDAEKKQLLDLRKNKFFQSYYLKLREEKDVKPNYNLFLQINTDVLSRFEETK